MSTEDEERKALLALGMGAGMLVGVGITFAAMFKAAWDQAKKDGDH